ncbi:uncharacterized protein LOC113004723 isoform X3 [Solenopsis invicta]|uniref:uncharacterized protein LOC113004723 isoform X3 n=1 Tax=Solenopsis invicta TaxID=13686 RepID=UPI00193DED0F|nr:uncharacterized protein LOC113004723 isoform X3 [Solenopsis invicta]
MHVIRSTDNERIDAALKMLFVKVWYVVIGDEWCSVVPDSWVFESDSVIWWPPKGITVTTAISKEIQPNDTWSLTPYKQLIGPFEAWKIEKKSADISSDADTDAMRAAFDEPSKRPKKVRKLSSDESDTSDASSCNMPPIYQQRKENTPKTISTISLPKCSYIKSKQRCEGSLTKTSQSQMNKSATFSSNYEKTYSTPKRINDLNEKQHKSKKLSGISSANFGKTKPAMMERHQEWHDECYLFDIQELLDSLQLDKENQTRNHNNCCGECRDYVQKEFKKLSRQLYKIEALLKEPNAGRGDEVVGQELLPSFPLMALQQFFECDNQLKVDANMRKQFEHMIGGSTDKQFIRNILSHIMCNEIGTQISWTGQKSGVGFKSTSLSKLIIDSVMKRSPASTRAELEAAMQEWLRRSGDRIRSTINNNKMFINQ